MGIDVMSMRDAWRIYRTMLADERIRFVPEPGGLEAEWQRLTTVNTSAPRLWTDAYLAAFADAAGMRLVTLDRAIVSVAKDALLLR